MPGLIVKEFSPRRQLIRCHRFPASIPTEVAGGLRAGIVREVENYITDGGQLAGFRINHPKDIEQIWTQCPRLIASFLSW
jgi:hypothetical protein